MKVTVYTTTSCVQCMSTKRVMTREGIRYDEIALEQHPDLIDKFKDMGHVSAPIVVTDTKTWSGFRLDKIMSLAQYLRGEAK